MPLNNSEYLKTILSLFDKPKRKYVITLATNNDKTIDTSIILYVFYKYNLFPYSIATNIVHDKIIKDAPDDTSNGDEDEKLLTVSGECCTFIDRIIMFSNNKLINRKGKNAKELNIDYMSYLMLTDKTLLTYEIFKNCLAQKGRDYAISTLQNILLQAYNIPSDQVFFDYGRFLTNPFQDQFTVCIGRDKELSDIVDILSRKKKNSPILVGQPGVGKTSIVEGFANILMSSKCPKQFVGYHLYELSLSTMLSGARYRGDFEERLEKLLQAVFNADSKIIIFIDEIHNIVSNNREAVSSGISAGDILKPYLGRSNFYLIGATTEQEYKVIQRDKALDRRFSVVHIKEPNSELTTKLLCDCLNEYENHFNISIDNALMSDVVNLAHRYLPNRFMPDKALDLLDESCVQCVNHDKSNELQLSHIISATELMSGITIPTAQTFNKKQLNKIIKALHEDVIGQDEAIESIIKCLKKYFVGVTVPNKPIGSFLFVGPTGTGKTALCKALAYNLFTKESFVRIDMSEYMEKHSVAKLIGAPPGYIGHGNGGVLTEAVKNNPFSVILFDEVEKAHPDVVNVLLQILDDGILTDSEGYTVNFTNCIIVLTSNVGAEDVRIKTSTAIGFNNEVSNKDTNRIYEKCVKDKFKPEFLNRLTKIIYFNSLTKDNIHSIIHKELDKVIKRFENNKITLTINNDVINSLTDKCYSPEYGARYAQRLVSSNVEDVVVDFLIDNNLINVEGTKVVIKYIDESFICELDTVKI